MRRWISMMMILVMLLGIQTSVFAVEEVVKDKPGANMMIPVEAEGIVVKSLNLEYSVDEPQKTDKDNTNVDQYRGFARVSAEYVLENISESVQHVTIAFLENEYDEIESVNIMGDAYEMSLIEVDRLTNTYEEGLNLSREFNVSRQQIIDRILTSKTDGIENYITGIWQEVYLIELDVEPGKMSSFTIDYIERSGTSRRNNSPKESVPWEPEFYYYFDYFSFFEDVETIKVTVHLPKDFEIEHTSYDGFIDIAPDVYQLEINGRPESNLIYTSHDPDNKPEDTGLEDALGFTIKLMIVSGIVIVLLVVFLLFNAFIMPIIKKRREAKKVEKLKNKITSDKEVAETETEEPEVMDTDDVIDLGLDLTGDTEGEPEVTDPDLETQAPTSEESSEAIDAIETVDSYLEKTAEETEEVHPIASEEVESVEEPGEQVEKTELSEEKLPFKLRLERFIYNFKKAFASLFSKKQTPESSDAGQHQNLKSALEADLDLIIETPTVTANNDTKEINEASSSNDVETEATLEDQLDEELAEAELETSLEEVSDETEMDVAELGDTEHLEEDLSKIDQEVLEVNEDEVTEVDNDSGEAALEYPDEETFEVDEDLTVSNEELISEAEDISPNDGVEDVKDVEIDEKDDAEVFENGSEDVESKAKDESEVELDDNISEVDTDLESSNLESEETLAEASEPSKEDLETIAELEDNERIQAAETEEIDLGDSTLEDALGKDSTDFVGSLDDETLDDTTISSIESAIVKDKIEESLADATEVDRPISDDLLEAEKESFQASEAEEEIEAEVIEETLEAKIIEEAKSESEEIVEAEVIDEAVQEVMSQDEEDEVSVLQDVHEDEAQSETYNEVISGDVNDSITDEEGQVAPKSDDAFEADTASEPMEDAGEDAVQKDISAEPIIDKTELDNLLETIDVGEKDKETGQEKVRKDTKEKKKSNKKGVQDDLSSLAAGMMDKMFVTGNNKDEVDAKEDERTKEQQEINDLIDRLEAEGDDHED